MSKRLTLSERFDSLSVPKYDDMEANEEHVDDIDADSNNQSNGDTTFTVVNRAAESSIGNRNQRISHVIGSDGGDAVATTSSSSSHSKYGSSRATGARPFRRALNPSPYSSSSQTQLPSEKSQFHTNRNPLPRSRLDNYQTNRNNAPRFNDRNLNNRRSAMQSREGLARRKKNSQGMNMNVRTNTNTSMRGARTGMGADKRQDMRRNIGSGPRSNFANRGGGGVERKTRGDRTGNRRGGRGGRGEGRNANRLRNSNKKDLSEQQLDKELEKYYANNDPKKLNEMKNEQLDRELDEYWTAPEEKQPSNNDTKSK